MMRLYVALAVVVVFAMLPIAKRGSSAVFAQSTGSSPHAPKPFIYTGVGSCASSNCHGSVTPQSLPKIDIAQNEHYIWLKKDKHARAYEVLHNKRSLRIAKILGLQGGAHQSPKCLTCHALMIPAAQQGPYYQIEDGVSCETCHGPAERWLGTHITRDYKASLQVGMHDTKDLVRRAETCVSCHVGDAQRDVNHQMIAAGHPDLLFELDTFTALMPPHWRPATGKWLGAKAWGIGQAVALRDIAKRLARRVEQRDETGWPEFADFDCYACHHEVRNIHSTAYSRSKHGVLKEGKKWQASWRQSRGYKGIAGLPAWEPAQYLVFRHLVGIVSPDNRNLLDQQLANLASQMQQLSASNPQRIRQAALHVADTVAALIPQVAKMTFNETLVATLLRNISAEGESLANAGIGVAEQAAMAVDTLFITYKKHVKNGEHKAIDDTIQQIFNVMQKPQTYDPQVYSRHMQTLHGFFAPQ